MGTSHSIHVSDRALVLLGLSAISFSWLIAHKYFQSKKVKSAETTEEKSETTEEKSSKKWKRGELVAVLSFQFDEKKTLQEWCDLVNSHLAIWKIPTDMSKHAGDPVSLYEATVAIQRYQNSVGYVSLGFLALQYVYMTIVAGVPIFNTCIACGGTKYIHLADVDHDVAVSCPKCHLIQHETITSK